MTTVASFRNSEYETTCTKCGEPLIAPEWSEYVNEQSVLNLSHCTKCGCRFETEICAPADTEADAVAIKDFFPSLLVALIVRIFGSLTLCDALRVQGISST